MLKNMNVNKKWNFYKVIYTIFVIAIIVGLILPYFFLLQLKSPEEINSAVSLSSIAGYLRFLAGSRNQMIINIAIHNIAIAIFAFILSFLSSGVIGCFFLFINCFILSTTLFGIHTLPTIVFVILEFIGICISTFGGLKLAEKRKNGLNFKGIIKYSAILVLIINIIYFVAAFIESKVILNQWG